MNDHAFPCNAGVPPAGSGASRPRFGSVLIRHRGRLPHWEIDAGLYFVTFRLADSLPASLLARLTSERTSLIANARSLGRPLSQSEMRRIEALTRMTERYLDRGIGGCALRRPPIASLVAHALRYFDGKRYRLFSWCIMPNHVHSVFRLFPRQHLAAHIHSWKSFTAKQANRMLKRAGEFWAREYYDHLIRNEQQLERITAYIINNPVRAGLSDWPWVWWWGQDAPTTADFPPALR